MRRIRVSKSRMTQVMKGGGFSVSFSEPIPNDLELRFMRDAVDVDDQVEFVFASVMFEEHTPGTTPPDWFLGVSIKSLAEQAK